MKGFIFVPGAGLELYEFSIPIGWIGALRFQSSSIGLQVRATDLLHKSCTTPVPIN